VIRFGYPDSQDQNRNENSQINKGENVFEFNSNDEEIDYGSHLIYDDWKLENALKKNLRELAFEHNSNAIIVIKNDTILYEEYFKEFNSNSLISSYSISKSILSVLIGIAMEEGNIKDLNQSITEYIPELKNKEQFNKVNLIHLMNHTSGIKSNRLLDVGLYYGDSFWELLSKIKLDKEPGTYQEYQNINTQLLGVALTRATNASLSDYLSDKIWSKIGVKKSATWSVFAKEGIEKTFCCISATAIDYAKFGRLILNDGFWNGKQIISKNWIDKIMSRNTTEGSSRSYNMSWYLGLEKYQDLMAIGLYKQFIYICKSDNVIIVRFGEREKKLHEEKARWPRMFRETVDQLN
jgi:CubicO group peptidase (beta-lactamase class C family)